MNLRSSNLIGLAVGDREIIAAQLRRGRLEAWARWEIPGNVSLAKPEAMGAALGSFLRSRGLDAKRAVVGLPARWLLSEPRQLPPMDEKQALASLRLQAERLSVDHEGGVVFDATGAAGGGEPSQALLVGVSEGRLGQVKKMCEAAGLAPAAVTATGLVYGEALGPTEERPVVLCMRHGAELLWRGRRGTRMFRHLAASGREGAATAALGSELRRVLTMSGAGTGGAGAGGGARAVARTEEDDGSGLASDNEEVDRGEILLLGEQVAAGGEARLLAERLERSVASACAVESLRHLPALRSVNGQAGELSAEGLGPAIVLAWAGRSPERLPVNFLDPKLAAPAESRVSRAMVLAAAVALAVVLGVGWLWWETRQAEALAASQERQLKEMENDLTAARERIERVNFGRGFFDARTPVLEALREVSLAFGPDGRIWTTGFSMQENGVCRLDGRATDQRSVMALRDRMMASDAFADVHVQDLRAAAGAGQMSFTLTFRYVAPAGGES